MLHNNVKLITEIYSFFFSQLLIIISRNKYFACKKNLKQCLLLTPQHNRNTFCLCLHPHSTVTTSTTPFSLSICENTHQSTCFIEKRWKQPPQKNPCWLSWTLFTQRNQRLKAKGVKRVLFWNIITPHN